MPFQKGRSGNPSGRAVDKPWREALMLAVNGKGKDGRKKLRHIAEAMVNAAVAGDTQAAKEIGDRLDGKPAQAIDHGIQPGQNIKFVMSLGDGT